MIPSAINNKFTELPHGNNICREQWDDVEFETGYAVTLLILLLVGPVIIMGIAYMLIAMTLYIGMKMDCQSEPGTCISLLVFFNNVISFIQMRVTLSTPKDQGPFGVSLLHHLLIILYSFVSTL